MKKSRLAGLFFLLPAAILCSCASTPTLTLSANWYKNTQITTLSDTYEALEYEVGFTSSIKDDSFAAEYDKGTYTTELKNEMLTLADGTTKEGYVYSTKLNISGRFTMKGEKTETFDDYVYSTVKFLSVGDKLQPVESMKEVQSTTPVNAMPSTLKTAYRTYHYTYGVKYDEGLIKAQITYRDLTAVIPEDKVTDVKIESDYAFLDNEEIMFALRGMDFSASNTFRTINPVKNAVHNVTTSATSETVRAQFTMNGKEVDVENMAAYTVTVSYQTTYSGQSQKLTLAAKGDANNNTYRNVVLTMDVPILQSLGTMNYKLVKADFSEKA